MGSFFPKWLSTDADIERHGSCHTAMCCFELWKPNAWALRASHTAVPDRTDIDSNSLTPNLTLKGCKEIQQHTNKMSVL